jgi:hypothetical protein
MAREEGAMVLGSAKEGATELLIVTADFGSECLGREGAMVCDCSFHFSNQALCCETDVDDE